MSSLEDIAAERRRQIDTEGWTVEHDDEHDAGQLASAAACYALAAVMDSPSANDTTCARYWPWERKWWKPTDRRRNLVKAGALIVAEIERLDRLSAKELT